MITFGTIDSFCGGVTLRAFVHEIAATQIAAMHLADSHSYRSPPTWLALRIIKCYHWRFALPSRRSFARQAELRHVHVMLVVKGLLEGSLKLGLQSKKHTHTQTHTHTHRDTQTLGGGHTHTDTHTHRHTHTQERHTHTQRHTHTHRHRHTHTHTHIRGQNYLQRCFGIIAVMPPQRKISGVVLPHLLCEIFRLTDD